MLQHGNSASGAVAPSPGLGLLACCAIRPLPEHTEAWRAQLGELALRIEDWAGFVHLVRRQQLPTMACDAAKQIPAGIIPPQSAAALHRADRTSRLKTLRRIAETRTLLAAFKSAGIAAVQLKGTSLTQRLHGDAFLRDSVDLDVLVALNDFSAASRVLTELGATSQPHIPLTGSIKHRLDRLAYHHGVFILPASGLHVELHWRMNGWPAEFAAEEIKRSTIDPASGERILRPAVEMVDLILHGCSHYWYRFKWLADIRQAQITWPRAAWEETAAAARELGAMHALRMTSVLAAWLFEGIGPRPEFEPPATAAAKFTARYALRRMMSPRIDVSGPRAAVDRSAYRLLAATPYGRVAAVLRCVCRDPATLP